MLLIDKIIHQNDTCDNVQCLTFQGTLWAFCHYSFIFDGQSKTLLLKVDAHIQMTVSEANCKASSI